MNQIISQHGWGLDHSVWDKLKNQFIKNHWIWQDNDRGYFSLSSKRVNWIKDNSEGSLRIAICHSLGIHLIKKNIIKEATHIVLINSFNNFIPTNNQSKLTLRALKKMEKKINPSEVNFMLKEFINRSFLPNKVDKSLKSIIQMDKGIINTQKLLNDFKKLYMQGQKTNFFSKYTEILFIQSKKDLILKEYASNEFIEMLNKSQFTKPKLIELEREGHLIKNIDIGEIIENWLKLSNYG